MPDGPEDANISLAFAEELIGLAPARLTAEDVEQLQRLVLDHAAVTLCGSVQPWGRKLTAWARQHGGPGHAVLIGSGDPANAASAALANGTSAHGYELDDTHEPSRSHPGAVVISAALAVGAERGSTGREVMAAIVAGYEAMTRIGMAAGAVATTDVGFHATCLFGPFGAAAAAARLMGLDAAGLAQAWGIALSMTGGSAQFAFEPKGTMVKRMHGGIPAQNGVIAAQLAGLGVAAPVRALEGEYGFFHLFGRDVDPGLLQRRADGPFQIHRMSFKPYSCCRKFHSLIDALETATDGFALDPDAIERIEVHSPAGSIEKHQMRRPDSVMAAQYSMPYIVGATLAYGPRRYDAYGTAFHEDERILGIVDRVEAVLDESLNQYVPQSMPNRVVVRLRDGSSREETVIESLGAPERLLSLDGVRDKAAALFDMVDPDIDLDRIVGGVADMADTPDIGAFVRSLVIPRYDAADDRAA
ncbi:MAG: MmgE/PrpD family protein [Alphaproteobacteria bacterium]|nr:MmgE/PrpD family protein [Alphaproteobacteria bacterium]